MKIEILSLILSVLFALTHAKYHDNVFNEELVIKELNNDFVNTYFQFTTRWNIKTHEDRNFD